MQASPSPRRITRKNSKGRILSCDGEGHLRDLSIAGSFNSISSKRSRLSSGHRIHRITGVNMGKHWFIGAVPALAVRVHVQLPTVAAPFRLHKNRKRPLLAVAYPHPIPLLPKRTAHRIAPGPRLSQHRPTLTRLDKPPLAKVGGLLRRTCLL